MTQRRIEYWVIPPQADAEFVAHMEQVLDLYQKPYDPNCPVVCMDEQPVQLVQETRPPMAATKNRPRRVDYEYERAGTAAVFLFSEPLAGWRQATARARRTKVDWALEVAGLLEGRYADCPKITLVCDHLNTHTKGAFYEVFEPARARELVRRIEFCHTPKHGSWLNIAENELSSMTRQCVRGRRIGDLGTLHDEVSAWSTDVNGTQRGVDWQMKVDDARWKLKSVYPHIITCRTTRRAIGQAPVHVFGVLRETAHVPTVIDAVDACVTRVGAAESAAESTRGLEVRGPGAMEIDLGDHPLRTGDVRQVRDDVRGRASGWPANHWRSSRSTSRRLWRTSGRSGVTTWTSTAAGRALPRSPCWTSSSDQVRPAASRSRGAWSTRCAVHGGVGSAGNSRASSPAGNRSERQNGA